jgi:two-component system NtrC family sensor kinase
VVGEGESWIGRAYVVNNWYITAYEPIRNLRGEIIGILYVGLLEQKYLDLKWRSIQLFLSVTLLGALASMALAYVIAKRISVPVQQLVAASRQLAQGNLDAKVQVDSADELRDLADSFNYMAAALKKRDDQLKEFATRKIMESERLAIIGQLAANVAHELNNPLQGIVSYSHLLLERLPPDGPHRMSVQKIATQANRCSLIIRGLLDFSRQRKPQKRPANLNSVVSECVALVQDQALFHNISIQKNLQADLPPTVMDPSEMQQVMMNMFINAAEAMDGQGELRVSTRVLSGEDFVEVVVSDTGRGIPEEEIEHIFDPFFTTKEVGHGTGLGLAISFGIVKEHSGSISVESEIGKGTTFTLRLPLVAVEAGVASD